MTFFLHQIILIYLILRYKLLTKNIALKAYKRYRLYLDNK